MRGQASSQTNGLLFGSRSSNSKPLLVIAMQNKAELLSVGELDLEASVELLEQADSFQDETWFKQLDESVFQRLMQTAMDKKRKHLEFLSMLAFYKNGSCSAPFFLEDTFRDKYGPMRMPTEAQQSIKDTLKQNKAAYLLRSNSEFEIRGWLIDEICSMIDFKEPVAKCFLPEEKYLYLARISDERGFSFARNESIFWPVAVDEFLAHGDDEVSAQTMFYCLESAVGRIDEGDLKS